jgi:serine/threonine protein kinase
MDVLPKEKNLYNVFQYLTTDNKATFQFIKIVGKGGFGRVWKVLNKKTKLTYALKVIDKARVLTKKSVNSIMSERQILSELLQEPNNFIVNIKCSFQDR